MFVPFYLCNKKMKSSKSGGQCNSSIELYSLTELFQRDVCKAGRGREGAGARRSSQKDEICMQSWAAH